MDEKTAKYYENHAQDLLKRYNSAESPLASLVPVLFEKGQRVLDVGCGSGRDVSLLLEMGYDAYGIEPSDSLRELSVKSNPKLDGHIFKGSLPYLHDELTGEYDHIILSAVLMHIPDNSLFESAYSLRSMLKKG
ncbi:MAG TPA: methyltransferase type 11, partial [Spirochaeta sp.]|nr:methyltransferase type 11 [Spirochaeta sp.]